LKIQFLMGIHSSSDPSVWETAVMDVVPSSRASSTRGKGLLVFASVAAVAAVGMSIMYFAKYSDNPEVPAVSEPNSGGESEPTLDPPPSTPQVPSEAQIDYIEKATEHWENGNKTAAMGALDRAEQDPGDAEEARLLRESFKLDEKMDRLYQMTADGQYETVLDDLELISMSSDIPLYESLNKRYQALKLAAEDGYLDTLYERGISTVRKGKVREAKRVLAIMQTIDPENDNAAKLARKIKAKERGDSATTTPARRRPRPDPPEVKPKPRPRPTPRPEVAASGGPDDWYKEARKARYSNTSRAISLLKKVVKSRPGHFRAHKLLGMIYQSQGNKSLAIKHIKKALTIRSDPGLQQFLERLQ